MFKDKYCIDADKGKDENINKIVISNDTYALGELLEEIKYVLRRK